MLGAAHVLAMDSKNLLDVVDAIRIRYPHIKPYNVINDKLNPQSATSTDLEPQQSSEVDASLVYHPNLPDPVSCTFVQYPLYSQNASSTSAANVSGIGSGQLMDS